MNGWGLGVESGAAIGLLLGLAWWRPHLGAQLFRRLERGLGWAAAGHRWSLTLTAVGVATLALHALLSLAVRWPVPSIHDEFSYLLAADTFAQGRLTNPPHPLWPHFESFHILQQPTYASKYPPGQGLVLALGQVMGGAPIVGAWIGAALMVVAVGWALRAWVPAKWALVGALLTATHPTMVRWGQSYWGGAVAAVGGALVIGAAGRLLKQERVTRAGAPPYAGWWLGLGLAILAVSRPYEGVVLGVTAITLVAMGTRQAGWAWRWKVLGPVLVCVVAVAGWLGYYNWRVTGMAWRLPYAVYQEQYGKAPVFLWQEAQLPRKYSHLVMEQFYAGNGEEADYRQQESLAGFFNGAADKVQKLVAAVLPLHVWNGDGESLQWVAVGVFVAGLRLVWGRRLWRIGVMGLMLFAGLLASMWLKPHYAAPAVVLVAVASVEALRRLGSWRCGGQRSGRLPSRVLIVVGMVLPLSVVLVPAPLGHGWDEDRARLETHLRSRGQHLVFIHYGDTHPLRSEWVYNHADLNAAPVVWARDMGPARNRLLIEAFPNRQVWLVAADAPMVGLSPYAAGQDLILGPERPAGQ